MAQRILTTSKQQHFAEWPHHQLRAHEFEQASVAAATVLTELTSGPKLALTKSGAGPLEGDKVSAEPLRIRQQQQQSDGKLNSNNNHSSSFAIKEEYYSSHLEEQAYEKSAYQQSLHHPQNILYQQAHLPHTHAHHHLQQQQQQQQQLHHHHQQHLQQYHHYPSAELQRPPLTTQTTDYYGGWPAEANTEANESDVASDHCNSIDPSSAAAGLKGASIYAKVDSSGELVAASNNSNQSYDHHHLQQQQQQQAAYTAVAGGPATAYPLDSQLSSNAATGESNQALGLYSRANSSILGDADDCNDFAAGHKAKVSPEKQTDLNYNGSPEYNQLRILEMRKEKSRDAARSRRSKENHEFYELAKLLPLPAAITSQLDFLDKASIIRLTISFLKLRQFSVNGYPPWAPDFTTLGSVNPYSSQSLSNYSSSSTSSLDANNQQLSYSNEDSKAASVKHQASYASGSPSSIAFPLGGAGLYQASALKPVDLHHQALVVGDKCTGSKGSANLFDIHQGTHILQSLDGFAFAIGRDGRFLYISETVSMYLGLSQVEMTGSSVFDYTHQQDHEELAQQLGIRCIPNQSSSGEPAPCDSPAPASVHSQYSAASNETLIDDHLNCQVRKKARGSQGTARGAYGRSVASGNKRLSSARQTGKMEPQDCIKIERDDEERSSSQHGTDKDPLVRQFCIRMKSTLTKRGCQHFKSSGYRVVHVVAHLRSYQSNDHGHLMDPLDEATSSTGKPPVVPQKRRGPNKRSDTQAGVRVAVGNDNTESSESKEESSVSGSRKVPAAKPQKIIGMVAVAIALPPPSINELKLESDTFVLRLGLDLRVTHIEPKITELLSYPIDLIAGKSLYSLVHPADVFQVQKCHRDLLRKGQMMSGYYRLLARGGGYIWVQTCATLICNNTLASQTTGGVSSSPMPMASSSSTPQLGLQAADLAGQQHKNYLIMQASSGVEMQNNYVAAGSNKLLSPGLSSGATHLSSGSNYDPDQDQCVIFVNYMITGVIESESIVDICQSSACGYNLPAANSFSGNNSNNSIFNNLSPSQCSSSSSLKLNTISNCRQATIGSSSTSASAAAAAASYVAASPASTPSSHNSLSSGSPSGTSSSVAARTTGRRLNQQQSVESKLKLANGRRTGAKGGKIYGNQGEGQLTGGSLKGELEGKSIYGEQSSNSNLQPDQQAGNNSALYSSYSQQIQAASGAACQVGGADSWQYHPLAAAAAATSDSWPGSAAAYGATQDHYSLINQPIYKAAFGLDAASVVTGHHHHYTHHAHHHHLQQAHQHQVYHPLCEVPYAGSAGASSTSAAQVAGAAATNWDTSQRNHYNHNGQYHHHHHQPTSHQPATVAAAAAANSYYKYYGTSSSRARL